MLNVKNLAALILCSCWSVCEHKDVCISIDNSCVFTVVLINAPLLNLYVFLCPADAKCNLSKSNYLWSPQTCLLACFPFSFPPPHTYIINIWEAGCLGGGLTYVPSEMSVAPPVAGTLLTKHQTALFEMWDSIMVVCFISWPRRERSCPWMCTRAGSVCSSRCLVRFGKWR